ncbi:ETX/MTX2 family pore-forming toxin [Bacillus thuringiensis]|uniref:ETX/MTX2 family pore-forming toxin n=1 Tax=Bacillus thuringiensis TaxID=1428 RepID=UPI00159B9DAB|nr:ETX/MTX2 family pore-forming toxin [Bacillus thuringiensis]
MKMKKIAPLAVLSTAVLLSPANSFAEGKSIGQPIPIAQMQSLHAKSSKVAVDEQVIKNDMATRIFETVKTDNSFENITKEAGIMVAIADWIPKFTNTSGYISIPEVTIDSYTDGNIELGSYKNDTKSTQKLITPSQTEEEASSFTYTSSDSEKIGLDTDTKVGVDIPFVGEADTTIKTIAEFTFTQTSTKTDSTKKSITYPSQTLECLPGYVTSLIIRTSQANFSGDMEIGGKIINLDQLDLGGFASISSNQDLYKIYKETSSTIPLPAGVVLDDTNQTVKFSRSFPFNGVAGHLTAAEATQVKIESLDKSKKTVIMSLQDYQNQKMRDHVLQQNQ